MKNIADTYHSNKMIIQQPVYQVDEILYPQKLNKKINLLATQENIEDLTEILVVTSYPPRECGIATYSQDLIKAVNNKFSNSFSINVCALEAGKSDFEYPEEVKFKLDTTDANSYTEFVKEINSDKHIQLILIQHEFGFYKDNEPAFRQMLNTLKKPIVIVFHTVLPNPDDKLKQKIKDIASVCKSIIVMTKTSADILMNEYEVPKRRISIIAHGTHLITHLNEKFLKEKYGLKGKKVLTTFGLLSSGKSIETTLDALPAIIKEIPYIMFLIIGKTHPEVVKHEGEIYRESLMAKVKELKLEDNVQFINKYLDLPVLLEYLQLTDIYIFTTNDPNQAVSGTFVYAMSCGCPIISTPIPHAKEVLTEDTGIIFDFKNSALLADGVIRLMNDYPLRKCIIANTLQKIVSTSWENSAVAHAKLFESKNPQKIELKFNVPPLNLNHVKLMTTDFGILQFSKVNIPDLKSGYTLDDNARALIVTCMLLKSINDNENIEKIQTYLDFISFCQLPNGVFLNYVDENKVFTNQNDEVNLDDANGRAVWALGYLVSMKNKLPYDIFVQAESVLQNALEQIDTIHSTRAMAFAIKGIFYYNKQVKTIQNVTLIKVFADRLVQMFKHESSEKWMWFESYLTYANSILPESLLYAWLITGDIKYKGIAKSAFKFLIANIFNENGIEVISNRKWLKKGEIASNYGEQPIDVSYTIMTLNLFYEIFQTEDYLTKLHIAFDWFLGENRLKQIVYNPCTGGCYDGLEETHVNLNQGAESTLSYLMARLTMDKYNDKK